MSILSKLKEKQKEAPTERRNAEVMREAIKIVSHAWNAATPEFRDTITKAELYGLGKIPTETVLDVEIWKNAWLRILKTKEVNNG